MWWQVILAQASDATVVGVPATPGMHAWSGSSFSSWLWHGTDTCDVSPSERSIEPCKGLLNPVFSEGTELIVWAHSASDLPWMHISAVPRLLLSWAGWRD